MTKSEAIRQAERHYGSVSRRSNGSDQWAYTSYSEQHRAWWQPSWRQSYMTALAWRAQDVAREAACILLGYPQGSCEHDDVSNRETPPGTVRGRLDWLLLDLSKSPVTTAETLRDAMRLSEEYDR